jgi:hypothetical protein
VETQKSGEKGENCLRVFFFFGRGKEVGLQEGLSERRRRKIA